MTGRENISFKCYVLGLGENEIKEIEQKVIDFADLGEYIDQPVRTYSSGMKMRLGFAININQLVEFSILKHSQANRHWRDIIDFGQVLKCVGNG